MRRLRVFARVVHGLVREHVTKRHLRSRAWPEVRRVHVRQHPVCAACGGTRLLQVHHKMPFHLKPELELDPTNLITLCMGRLCHIDIGHGNDYRAYNPNVEKHAAQVLEHPEERASINAQAEAERLYATTGEG